MNKEYQVIFNLEYLKISINVYAKDKDEAIRGAAEIAMDNLMFDPADVADEITCSEIRSVSW